MEMVRKVGIIGLRPRQIRELTMNSFNAELSFYTEKNFEVAKVAAFCRKHEDIIVLSSHVPFKCVSNLPHHAKTIPGNVGLSSLVRYIETSYGIPGGNVVQTNQKPKQDSSKEMNAKPIIRVEIDNSWQYSMLLTGACTYGMSDTTPAIEKKTGQRFNFTTLLACSPGDVIRYMHSKEDKEDVNKLRQSIYFAVRSYTEKLGIFLEAHVHHDFTDIVVTDRRVKSTDVVHVTSVTTPAELTEAMRRHALTIGAVVNVSFIHKPVITVVEPVDSIKPLVVAGAAQSVDPDGVKFEHTEVSLAFWKQAYIAALGTGAGNERAKRLADQAAVDLVSLD